MDWEEILKRDDVVGGDIETHENEDTYRGPISEIVLKDDYVTINAEWIAVMESDEPGKWKKGHITQLIFPAVDSPPVHEKNLKRIRFTLIGFGPAVIFLKGGSKLDPAKVVGL